MIRPLAAHAGARLGLGEASFGDRHERETTLGQRDRPRRAREERGADLLFELLDSLTERGRRERDGARGSPEVEARGGFGEAAGAVERGGGGPRGGGGQQGDAPP